MDRLNHPAVPQLKGLLNFLHDLQTVTDSQENISLIRSYSFNYQDYQANRPIEEYRPHTSNLLLCKMGTNTIVKVL